jgi:hypothetical protein
LSKISIVSIAPAAGIPEVGPSTTGDGGEMPVTGKDSEKRVDGAGFGAKLERVLNQPYYRQSARRVSESMRYFGGAQAAALRIEEFLSAH